MKRQEIIDDPFYMPMLMAIEATIVSADHQAAAQGIALTDSQVRSAVHQAWKHPDATPPSAAQGSPREQILSELLAALLSARKEITAIDTLGRTAPIAQRDWILALKTVEDSIKRHATGSGSRAYLEFVEVFVR